MARGIYVHLPFCPYLCPYCDFAKWPHRASTALRYLDALYSEIARTPRVGASTIFFGGGTPNTYDAEVIASLTARVREHFSLPHGAEITLEANPELVDAQSLQVYRAAGITRLSLGVQSFVAAEIGTLGRRHTPQMVAQAVALARGAGFTDVSIDLIFAVPGQTRDSWQYSLDTALALEVDHISTYGLTVEEHTPYWSWREREPDAFSDNDLEADLYIQAMRVLQAAGYEHYEISNFARPGHRCRHNEIYWANGEYVGLGVGAASYRDGVRAVHTRDIESYIAAIAGGGTIPDESEALQGLAAVGEAIMLALRTADGVDFADFRSRYGVDVPAQYATAITRFERVGLLALDERGMRLTERGRPVANDVCGAFLSFHDQP